jgi:dienelactone hydrolase
MQRFTRSMSELWQFWLPNAKNALHPMVFTKYEDHQQVFAKLTSLDRDAWAEAYSAAARPFEEQARAAEARGDDAAAKENYFHAYGLYRMARFPTSNSAGKRAAYRKSQEMYLAALRYLPHAFERVEISFKGKPGEGTHSVGYFVRPKNAGKLPLVLMWAGIDTFKEDRTEIWEPILNAGMSLLLIDMPGTGDAPLFGSEDAERLWDAVLDWCGTRSEIDSKRIGIWGGSTGGYWAAKVAHTHRDRLAAAVAQGGCAHFAFTPEWIEKAQHGSYAFELAETLASAFGMKTFEEWVAFCPRLSLLEQGILDKPCAPMLLVNGTKDTIFPIEDKYLMLEHGDPKTARFYPVGHMGYTPDTNPMIVRWLKARLTA